MNFGVGTILQSGFYRFDILIEAPDGRHQRFGEYIRAMRPRFDGGLRINGQLFKVGESAYGRLINAGTDSIDTGYGFQVDRYKNGAWHTVGPNGDPFPAALIRIAPDTAAECFEISLESAWPPGHYRIVKDVKPVFGRLVNTRVSLGADFHIIE